MSKQNTRLPGHELYSEGAPFDAKGRRVGWMGTSGVGRGKCSCGAMSLELTSANKRKAWHRAHKDEIREASE